MPRTTSSSARATRSTSASSRDSCSGSTTTAHVYQDVYAGLYCVGCEAFKTEAELVDGKCPEHDPEPEWIEERNWFFRLSSFPAAAARAVRAPGLRPAGIPRQRGAELHRRRAAGLLDQPGRADVGDPDPVGSGFGRLRVGGRARQLPERADVRTAGRGSARDVLAVGAAPARARTSCASTASTGRRCCSRPATSRRSSCSSTGTCCSTTGRSRSRSATSSIRST